jgi:hypothetical protein
MNPRLAKENMKCFNLDRLWDVVRMETSQFLKANQSQNSEWD